VQEVKACYIRHGVGRQFKPLYDTLVLHNKQISTEGAVAAFKSAAAIRTGQVGKQPQSHTALGSSGHLVAGDVWKRRVLLVT
jgi:hypothetical protein